MATELKLPKLGVEMETAILDGWVLAEGDAVGEGDVVGNVETEKVVYEITANASGRIHLVGREGEEYGVGDRLALIAEDDDEYASIADSTPVATAATDAVESSQAPTPAPVPPPVAGERPAAGIPGEAPAPPAPRPRTGNGKVLASPLARRIAADNQLDLAAIEGSGIRGAIRRRDVERALASGSERRATAPAAGDTPSTTINLTRMRRTIAERMYASMQGTAQMTDIRAIDVSEVVEFRRRAVERSEKLGFRLGFPAIFAKAAVSALAAAPSLNAAMISASELRQYDQVNLGMAVAIPDGLVVPVVRGADQLSLRALNESLVEVIGRARERSAGPADFADGTFTITNFGSFGSHMGTPILNPPQTSILGLGAILDRPVVRAGEVVAGKVMHACLTVDHRVIDGETAGVFLNEFEALLADPETLLLS